MEVVVGATEEEAGVLAPAPAWRAAREREVRVVRRVRWRRGRCILASRMGNNRMETCQMLRAIAGCSRYTGFAILRVKRVGFWMNSQ